MQLRLFKFHNHFFSSTNSKSPNLVAKPVASRPPPPRPAPRIPNPPIDDIYMNSPNILNQPSNSVNEPEITNYELKESNNKPVSFLDSIRNGEVKSLKPVRIEAKQAPEGNSITDQIKKALDERRRFIKGGI